MDSSNLFFWLAFTQTSGNDNKLRQLFIWLFSNSDGFVLTQLKIHISYEPHHDKTNIMGLRPAWIQTSLRIRKVWSGSMLFAYKPYNK
jgi:hypothetical protein